eukprot:c28332_g1_i8 orf=636-1460(-)
MSRDPEALQERAGDVAGCRSSSNQSGDTTLTKLFVGGLAWETRQETIRDFFQQFGEILEAVVIMDKHTGRSKGYGFVTFRDPEAAKRACADPNPVIDGRMTNCNLAALGARRTRASTPQRRGSFRGAHGYVAGPASAQPVRYAHQLGFQYYPYGYSYPSEFQYLQAFHNPYATATYGGSVTAGTPPVYQYPFSHPMQGVPALFTHQEYGVQGAQILPYTNPVGSTIPSMIQFRGAVHFPPPMLPAGAVSGSQFVLPAPSQQQFTPEASADHFLG